MLQESENPGERFSSEGIALLAFATCTLMVSLVIISQSSDIKSRGKLGMRLIFPSLALLPAMPVAHDVPPFLLLAYFLVLATLQNFTATGFASTPALASILLEEAPTNKF